MSERVYLIGVYLPSCDHLMYEFVNYLSNLENTISALQPTDRVVIAGDFNAHITQPSHKSG